MHYIEKHIYLQKGKLTNYEKKSMVKTNFYSIISNNSLPAEYFCTSKQYSY